MNREIVPTPSEGGVLLFYMMTIGDSAVIVRFEEIDGSLNAGKSHVDDALETGLRGAGFVGWRCGGCYPNLPLE